MHESQLANGNLGEPHAVRVAACPVWFVAGPVLPVTLRRESVAGGAVRPGAFEDNRQGAKVAKGRQGILDFAEAT